MKIGETRVTMLAAAIAYWTRFSYGLCHSSIVMFSPHYSVTHKCFDILQFSAPAIHYNWSSYPLGMLNIDLSISIAAIGIATVAFIVACGQFLQQILGTVDGHTRCGKSVIGDWSNLVERRFRWY